MTTLYFKILTALVAILRRDLMVGWLVSWLLDEAAEMLGTE
jgi:hypothetical protein